MNLPDIYQKVFEILKAKGATDEQIAKTNEGVAQAAYEQLYGLAIKSLTEEDLTVLDNCPNQEEANKEILKRFTLRTGQNPDDIIQKFLADYAQGFLQEYEKEQAASGGA